MVTQPLTCKARELLDNGRQAAWDRRLPAGHASRHDADAPRQFMSAGLTCADGLAGLTTRAIICAALISSLVLLAPYAASAHRAPAPFINAGPVTMVTNGSAADLDPTSNEVAASANIAIN